MFPWGEGMSQFVLVFELDELQCAIDSTAVKEVVRAVAVRPMPGQSPFIAGVIDLRGSTVPVLDLRARFGRPSRALQLTDAFIVTGIRHRTVALWADRVVDVLPFDVPLSAVRDGFIAGTTSLAGVARLDDRLVMIHDSEAFLSQAEADAIASVSA